MLTRHPTIIIRLQGITTGRRIFTGRLTASTSLRTPIGIGDVELVTISGKTLFRTHTNLPETIATRLWHSASAMCVVG